MRRSVESDGDSRPRTIARSAAASPPTTNGSTGQRTSRLTSASTKVTIDHGRRMNRYSACRQATESPSVARSQPTAPSPRRRIRDGVGTSRPSSARARARSTCPSARQTVSPTDSSGNPITVTARPAPNATMTTT